VTVGKKKVSEEKRGSIGPKKGLSGQGQKIKGWKKGGLGKKGMNRKPKVVKPEG